MTVEGASPEILAREREAERIVAYVRYRADDVDPAPGRGMPNWAHKSQKALRTAANAIRDIADEIERGDHR